MTVSITVPHRKIHLNFRKSKFKWFITRSTGENQFLPEAQQQRIVSISKNMMFNENCFISNLLQWSSLWICKNKSGCSEKSEVWNLGSLIVRLRQYIMKLSLTTIMKYKYLLNFCLQFVHYANLSAKNHASFIWTICQVIQSSKIGQIALCFIDWKERNSHTFECNRQGHCWIKTWVWFVLYLN